MSVISQPPLWVITGSSPRDISESDVNLGGYKKPHSRCCNQWRLKTGWETSNPDNNSYLDIMYLSCVIVAVAGKNRHTLLMIYIHYYIMVSRCIYANNSSPMMMYFVLSCNIIFLYPNSIWLHILKSLGWHYRVQQPAINCEYPLRFDGKYKCICMPFHFSIFCAHFVKRIPLWKRSEQHKYRSLTSWVNIVKPNMFIYVT